MIEWIINNKVFFAVMCAAFISQGLKIILNVIKDKKGVLLSDFVVTGGMPSTHCALVSSLFAISLLEYGLSGLSAAAIVLFIIVITDSMGVRRTAGEEAKIVNKIIKLEKLKIHQLRYSMGHKPIEVLAGIIIGFFIGVSVFLIF
ncbi:MAG: divergent PAP2 family protein [Nanoarchaeota archaeon]|nr:divergent PAP2 family protein [Nanoarchaeota archaeon]